MAKLAPTSIKYIIKARIKAKGVIEKPDVIGAIFGQTEGLLGSDLDLRELQRTGRIGRIEVNIKSISGKSEGEIIIPSSLDSSETSLIAATLETIERVGPCTAEIQLDSVEDTRSLKREYVVDRAKKILENLLDTSLPDTEKVSEQIKESVRTSEVTTYHGLSCGPGISESDEIIIVEGRADVVNLLKFGVRNVIAIGGTSIPPIIFSLTKEKTATLFVDGDRGGELIAKELLQKTEIDFIAMAPEGKEVEELTKKEAYKALRSKIVSEQFKMEKHFNNKIEKSKKKVDKRIEKSEKRGIRGTPKSTVKLKPKQKELFKKTLEELVGTRAACILNEKNEVLGRVPVSELNNSLETLESPYTIIFDGKVDFKLNAIAIKKGIKFLIGMEKENIASSVIILSRRDL